MPRANRNENPICEECRFFQRGTKKMEEFEDGKSYLANGTCINPESPINKRRLVGSFSPESNQVHQRSSLITNSCFRGA